MTKIDGLEIVMTKHIKSEIDKELKKRFEELKPDIAKRYEELLNMRNMETDQFNDGFNDAIAGKSEEEHPHYNFDTDNWRLGYAWGIFEPNKIKIAKLQARIAQLEAERDEWKDDAERLAEAFVIEVYPHEWVCRSGCHHMGKTPDTIEHALGCPITLHRQLVEKYKKEVMR